MQNLDLQATVNTCTFTTLKKIINFMLKNAENILIANGHWIFAIYNLVYLFHFALLLFF